MSLWCISQGINYGDPKTEYGTILNSTIVTLLHTYGNTEKVTDALLYTHFVDLLRKTNLTKEEDCRILAIVAFICMETYRPNSITHMTIDDLSFKLYNHKIQEENQDDAPAHSIMQEQLRLLQEEFKENLVELAGGLTGIQESSNQIQLSCTVTMKKDKHLLPKDHQNCLSSHQDMLHDMLLVFMIYLWDIRRIGVQPSLAQALTSRNLSIKEEYKNTPLFVKNGIKNECISDFWGLLVKFGKKKKCKVHLTPRACRAHIPTQGCLSWIYQKMETSSLDLLAFFMEYGN